MRKEQLKTSQKELTGDLTQAKTSHKEPKQTIARQNYLKRDLKQIKRREKEAFNKPKQPKTRQNKENRSKEAKGRSKPSQKEQKRAKRTQNKEEKPRRKWA